MTAIVLQNVTKSYAEHTALDRVSLTVPEGRCLALIGHNGAGKTTLMKLLLGLIAPTSGRVGVFGEDPATAGRSFRRKLGFLPETIAFHEQMTGKATLAFFAALKGVPSVTVGHLLAQVGLASASRRRIKTYSKGMRQRLGLAQALLGEPNLLLLDEPTTGLDPVLRREFFDILRELTAKGTTIVLSSHNLTELEAHTDLAAILRDGRLAAFGDLDQLRRGAGLPVLVRAKGNAPAIAGRLNGSFVKSLAKDEATIEIGCAPAEKMDLLRTLASFGDLCSDVEVRQPSLDDLYLHYSGRRIGSDDDAGARP